MSNDFFFYIIQVELILYRVWFFMRYTLIGQKTPLETNEERDKFIYEED
jgi:hypothetical protein